jgi:hypothetical protein
MLSPTSLSGLSVNPDFVRPVRAVSPTTAMSQGASKLTAPLSAMPLTLPGGQQDGGPPSRSLPRGSLLDLSV